MHKFFGNAPTLVGGNCTRNDFFFFPFSTCSDPVLVEMRLEQRFSFFKKFFYYLFGNQGRWKPYPERKNVFLFSGISRSSLAKTKLEWSFLFLNFFSICLNHFFYLFNFFWERSKHGLQKPYPERKIVLSLFSLSWSGLARYMATMTFF